MSHQQASDHLSSVAGLPSFPTDFQGKTN